MAVSTKMAVFSYFFNDFSSTQTFPCDKIKIFKTKA
jgi:hypothetical protein